MKDSHHQSPDGEDVFKGKLPRLVQETARCSVTDMHGKDAQQARCAGCRVPMQSILAIAIRVFPHLFKADEIFLSALPHQPQHAIACRVRHILKIFTDTR